MALADRSARLRRLAGSLTEQFGLPWGHRQINAEYDERRREWTYTWVDGPTVAQVRRAAKKAQPEAVKGLLYQRQFSDEASVMAVVRMALAAEPIDEDFHGRAFRFSELEDFLANIKNPAPKAGREATIVANLLKTSEGHGYNFWDTWNRASDFVAKNGFARTLDGVELTPLELLTARYAEGRAERAWRFRLAPLTPLEAFSAVQADKKAKEDALGAALSLLPELHAALDAAAADMTTRLNGTVPAD
ncbi:hypothetical protein ABZV65_30685 [Streptomyces bauhiniae]|uniref:hypothetical protein n=1 Tax=Streptomyces bauhiniae TaxID=2340725 RepID=UPI0033A44F1B